MEMEGRLDLVEEEGEARLGGDGRGRLDLVEEEGEARLGGDGGEAGLGGGGRGG